MSRQFVIDASLTLSWCIADEAGDSTEEILDGLTSGDTAIAPALWIWEINNALFQVEARHRIDSAMRQKQSSRLQTLSIEIEDSSHQYVWNAVIPLAQKYKLTVYDATYLEMALRRDLPLGTLDKDLRKAAEKLSIPCLPIRFP